MICVFKCPKCGSKMRFSPETQRLICDSCNSEMFVSEYNEENITYEGASYYGEGFRKLECPNCGSVQITEGNAATLTCSYCGDEMAAIGMKADDIMPEKILPLIITERQALDHVIGWWIKHESMPELNIQKMKMTFTDMYIPVWLYDMDTVSTVSADVEHSLIGTKVDILSSNYKTGRDPNFGRKATDYHFMSSFNNYNISPKKNNMMASIFASEMSGFNEKINSNYDEKTSFSRVLKIIESSFQKIPYIATGHFSSERFHGIEPYNYYALRNFKASYLSGHNAENYEMTHEELYPHVTRQVKKYALTQCHTYVEGAVPGGEIKEITEEKCEIFPENVYYALVPIWICSYWYRGKKYYLYVNGQTGKTDGDVIFAKGKFEANVAVFSLSTLFAWMSASLVFNTLFFDFAIMIAYLAYWLIIIYDKYSYLFDNKKIKLQDNALKIKLQTRINLKQTVITRAVVGVIMLLALLVVFAGIKLPDVYTIVSSFLCGLVISITDIVKFSIKRKREMLCREEVEYKDYIVEAGTRILVSSRM